MISVRKYDDVTVVQPEIHRLDEMLGRQLIAAMREYVTPGAKIVLNLSDVNYLNSEALGYISTCTADCFTIADRSRCVGFRVVPKACSGLPGWNAY